MSKKYWKQIDRDDRRASALAERVKLAMQQAANDPAQLRTALGAAEEGKKLNDACLRRMESLAKRPRPVSAYDRTIREAAMQILAANIDHLRARGALFAQVLTAIAALRANYPETTEPVLGGRRRS